MHGSTPIGRAVCPGVARPAVAALLLLVAGGCTMCPSPFDYAGPVPNGSAPQNDFRARSNGILPLGGQPKPWPPVVEADPPTPQEPAVAAPESVVVAAAADATWLVAAAAETAADIATTAAETEEPAPVNDRPADATAVETAAAAGAVDPPAGPPPEAEPAREPEPSAAVLRETEGWRPKR